MNQFSNTLSHTAINKSHAVNTINIDSNANKICVYVEGLFVHCRTILYELQKSGAKI